MWKYFLKAGNGNMKAVYEMPKVSFEAFMANNAVAVCGNFLWDNVEDDDWDDDFPDSDDGSVLASAIGINGCRWNAGFADYSDFTKLDENDDITQSKVTFNTDEHSNQNNGLLDWTTGAVDIAQNLIATFKGWLYFSEGKGKHKDQYGTWGWSPAGGKLSYKQKEGVCDDAWLAPVFTSNGTSI